MIVTLMTVAIFLFVTITSAAHIHLFLHPRGHSHYWAHMPASANRVIGIIHIDSVSDRLRPVGEEESLSGALRALGCMGDQQDSTTLPQASSNRPRRRIDPLEARSVESCRVFADLPQLRSDLMDQLDIMQRRIREATPAS